MPSAEAVRHSVHNSRRRIVRMTARACGFSTALPATPSQAISELMETSDDKGKNKCLICFEKKIPLMTLGCCLDKRLCWGCLGMMSVCPFCRHTVRGAKSLVFTDANGIKVVARNSNEGPIMVAI